MNGMIQWAFLYDCLVAVLTLGRERRLRKAMLDAARVVPGENVLDVGCGTGTLALAAKRRVGPTGTVHATDAMTGMVARARRKAEKHGIEVSFEVATAQRLPFPESTFDVVLCTLVLHHLPIEARGEALAEMRRVLRPGGRLLVVDLAWARGWRRALHPIAMLHGHGAKCALRDAEALMEVSGFRDILAGTLGSGVLGWLLGHA